MLNRENELLLKDIGEEVISKINKYFTKFDVKKEVKMQLEHEILQIINVRMKFGRLSVPELKTLKLITKGCSKSQIANILCKTERCINMYKENIRRKLELNTMDQVVRLYTQHEATNE